MSTPVFVDVEPRPGCGCEDCARARLIEVTARRSRGSMGPRAAPVAVAVVAAAGAVAAVPGVTVAAPAPGNRVEAGHELAAAPQRLSGNEILDRAQTWVDAEVPYRMDEYWSDGYRQDCSGFVSMAWGLNRSEWTGSLPRFAYRIGVDDLEPGDILLYQSRRSPHGGSHVRIFAGWADDEHTAYNAYEQAPPHTQMSEIPLPPDSGYRPYRYKYLSDGGDSGGDLFDDFPGSWSFGAGSSNRNVTRLGRMLRTRGGGPYYRSGPGPRWGAADQRATRAFQRAQGWKGPAANGIPGPTTWRYLVDGKGANIGQGPAAPADPAAPGSTAPAPAGTAAGAAPTAYPGPGTFRPGQSDPRVLLLGRQLVAKGFGRYYRSGPGPRWGEADRRAVEAFQRAQGWSGREADGHPGPETWRRLFS
ncbi:peptidoglycan-binding protein [Streptomyces sp. NPDC088354]|uniref:peptidoglycan-binding protein n=1 Tax=Streptomyces sp. NPDC088354 TaxID=3365856 RepID=UPI003822120A